MAAPNQNPELDIKSILLLDDDIELADTLKLLLESHNFVVTVVRDGLAGLREVMAFDFDIIMCDMLMPHLPGDMFYLAVEKTKPELCGRFIFITGYFDEPKVAGFLSQLPNPFILRKPVEKEEIVRMISYVLQREPSFKTSQVTASPAAQA